MRSPSPSLSSRPLADVSELTQSLQTLPAAFARTLSTPFAAPTPAGPHHVRLWRETQLAHEAYEALGLCQRVRLVIQQAGAHQAALICRYAATASEIMLVWRHRLPGCDEGPHCLPLPAGGGQARQGGASRESGDGVRV